jgi:hypothetical protein
VLTAETRNICQLLNCNDFRSRLTFQEGGVLKHPKDLASHRSFELLIAMHGDDVTKLRERLINENSSPTQPSYRRSWPRTPQAKIRLPRTAAEMPPRFRWMAANALRKCSTWSAECADGHGTVKTGAPRGLLWRRIISLVTSKARIPDSSGLPARHEIQHSVAATMSNAAITHSLERRAALLPVI